MTPGRAVNAQLSIATPTGEDAYWFWSLDCYRCNEPMAAMDVTVSHGWVGLGPDASTAFSLGVGFSGIHPFIEGYVQAPGAETFALGAGVRLGGIGGWYEQSFYLRTDIALGTDVAASESNGLSFRRELAER